MRILLLATLLAACAVTDTRAGGLDELAWLSGRWVGTTGATITVEVWQPALGDTMLGSNQVSRAGQTQWFEFLRIEADADGVRYVASPGGEGGTAFTMVSSEPGLVVFEAPEHGDPQRITYRRTGDLLSVRVEQLDGSQRRSWTWRLAR